MGSMGKRLLKRNCLSRRMVKHVFVYIRLEDDHVTIGWEAD